MIIYRIQNKINNKCYIGQTIKTLEERWKQHCKPKQKRNCPLIHKAILKYGPESFNIEILEVCISKEQLNEREAYWISFYGSYGKGYNLRSGGDRSELAEISRLKISKTLTGRPTGRKGIKTNRPAWNKGRAWSLEMREKLSKAHIGLISKRKNGIILDYLDREILRNIRTVDGPGNKFKPIQCVETGEKFESCKAAAVKMGLTRSKICCVLKGSRKHTGGYTFIYLEKETIFDRLRKIKQSA